MTVCYEMIVESLLGVIQDGDAAVPVDWDRCRILATGTVLERIQESLLTADIDGGRRRQSSDDTCLWGVLI